MAQESGVESDADTKPETAENTKEDQQQIAVTFSLWQPPQDETEDETSSPAETMETMFSALQQFFCEDTELVVVNDNYKNVCSSTDSASGGDLGSIVVTSEEASDVSSSTNDQDDGESPPMSIADFLSESKEPDSYIANEVERLYMTTTTRRGDNDDEEDLMWTTWSVFYNVVYIGTTFVEQAAVMNASSALGFMEDVVQLALDVSLMEGIMDTRMEGTGLKMAMVGQEVNMFQDLVAENSDDDDASNESNTASDSQALEYAKRGKTLRWIGVVMLLTNLSIVLLLTTLARRRRKQIQEEEALLDSDGSVNEGLRTERDVEEMLERSRTFTTKNLSKTPRDLQGESEIDDLDQQRASPPESLTLENDLDEASNHDNRATVSTMMRSLSDLLASTSFSTSPQER